MITQLVFDRDGKLKKLTARGEIGKRTVKATPIYEPKLIYTINDMVYHGRLTSARIAKIEELWMFWDTVDAFMVGDHTDLPPHSHVSAVQFYKLA